MPSRRILVVEDEAIIARDIQAKLESKGYVVPDIAVCGSEALEKAEALAPDLVLMDIRLRGDMDGVQAAELIRTRYRTPVVYLTAYMDDATVQRAKLTQPFGYLLKPFQEKELHTAIEIALYRREMERQLEAAHAQLGRRVRELEARDRMVRLQMSGPSIKEAHSGILDALSRGLAASELVLYAPSGEAGVLVPAATRGAAPPTGEALELATRAFRSGRPEERREQRVAAVPITFHETPIGALWVQGLAGSAEPWEEAVQVLLGLAQQAALVLRMAQMTEDLDSGRIQVADLLELEAEEGDGPG